MNLTLRAETEKYIDDQIQAGRFPTPEAVVEAAIAELAGGLDDSLDAEDWAAIAIADAEGDRGEGIDVDEIRAIWLSALI